MFRGYVSEIQICVKPGLIRCERAQMDRGGNKLGRLLTADGSARAETGEVGSTGGVTIEIRPIKGNGRLFAKRSVPHQTP